MSGERESLWGERRKRPSVPAAENHGLDDGASPKAQKVLDLQRTAGNAAVTGAVQRSMWGDMEDWFGGGGGDNANLMTGGDQEQPGSTKGGGAPEQATAGPLSAGEASWVGGGEQGYGAKGGEQEQATAGPLSAGESSWVGGGEQGYGAKGGGYDTGWGDGAKGGGYDAGWGDGSKGGYGGPETDAEKGYADREEKGGYDGWGDGSAAPAGPEADAKGEDVYLN